MPYQHVQSVPLSVRVAEAHEEHDVVESAAQQGIDALVRDGFRQRGIDTLVSCPVAGQHLPGEIALPIPQGFIARVREQVLPVREDKKWASPPRRPNGLYLPRYLNVDRQRTNGMIRGFEAQMRNSSSYGSPQGDLTYPGLWRGFRASGPRT